MMIIKRHNLASLMHALVGSASPPHPKLRQSVARQSDQGRLQLILNGNGRSTGTSGGASAHTRVGRRRLTSLLGRRTSAANPVSALLALEAKVIGAVVLHDKEEGPGGRHRGR